MHDLNLILLQSDLIWKNPEQNRRILEASILKVPDDVEAIILPEMFTTGFCSNPMHISESPAGQSVQWMHNMAATTGKSIVGSIIIQENNAFYNRLFWINPDHTEYSYNKRHLFANGGEQEHFTPGEKRIIVPYKGWNILIQICYDLRFPVWSRNQFIDGNYEYDLAVYVANWPSSRSYQWKQLLIARAIENQCYVAGVNRIGTDGNGISYSGDSLLIDPRGNICFEAQSNTNEALACTLQAEMINNDRNRFPFAHDWDNFKIL